MKNWNRIYGGRANDALIAHLVRQIRTWRPDVLVIPAGRDGDGLNEITRQSVVTAVKLAGDPAYLGNQLLAAGCEPWNVQRVYLVTDSKSGGTIALTGDDWSPRLGQSWTDAALTARGLLERDYLAGPAAVSIQRIASNGSEATPRDLQRPLLTCAQSADIMSNIDSTGGGNSRRPPPDGVGPKMFDWTALPNVVRSKPPSPHSSKIRRPSSTV